MEDLENRPTEGSKTLSRVGSGWSGVDKKGKKKISISLDADKVDIVEKTDKKTGEIRQVIELTLYPCKRKEDSYPNYSISQLKDSEPDDFLDDESDF